jgi:hypothetical protein
MNGGEFRIRLHGADQRRAGPAMNFLLFERDATEFTRWSPGVVNTVYDSLLNGK